MLSQAAEIGALLARARLGCGARVGLPPGRRTVHASRYRRIVITHAIFLVLAGRMKPAPDDSPTARGLASRQRERQRNPCVRLSSTWRTEKRTGQNRCI